MSMISGFKGEVHPFMGENPLCMGETPPNSISTPKNKNRPPNRESGVLNQTPSSFNRNIKPPPAAVPRKINSENSVQGAAVFLHHAIGESIGVALDPLGAVAIRAGGDIGRVILFFHMNTLVSVADFMEEILD